MVTDGYQVYHKLGNGREDLKIVGCWIHARCYFADFINPMGKDTARGTIVMEAYERITDILHTDNGFDDLPVSDRKRQHQAALKGKVNACFEWAKIKYSQVTHNSIVGRTLAYSIIEIATANELNSYKYLELLLTEVLQHMNDKDISRIDDLLPWSPRIQKECPSKYKKS